MNKVIEHLVQLGHNLGRSTELENEIAIAGARNSWFVPVFVKQALDAIVNEMLDAKKLNEWLSPYHLHPVNKTVGLIFAGNVPLVGFHDFLCCYVAGCRMKIKLSSKDDELFPFVIKMLSQIDTGLSNRVEIIERLQDFDCIIATGSNNTNQSFEYYFRNYPKILRKNRNSVAILTGEENPNELEKLANDMFLYFGFGCRNVSKLYVPAGYDFVSLFQRFEKYNWLFQHSKYMNNYDYNRTILLLNKTPHLSNDFVMLLENTSIPSAIATVHFEYWKDQSLLVSHLNENHDKIQCIVASQPETWNLSAMVPFGRSQQPELWDYADGVDTLAFLLSLND